MWVRVVGKLLAVFGLYSIVLLGIGARMSGKSGGSYTPGLLELGAVTAVFLIAVAYVLTRRPRPRPPLDE